jgi:hypothetical protein
MAKLIACLQSIVAYEPEIRKDAGRRDCGFLKALVSNLSLESGEGVSASRRASVRTHHLKC